STSVMRRCSKGTTKAVSLKRSDIQTPKLKPGAMKWVWGSVVLNVQAPTGAMDNQTILGGLVFPIFEIFCKHVQTHCFFRI
ncbi:MAG: hypothetical protein ACK5V9_04915, partial [Burkholderiales bacterium]